MSSSISFNPETDLSFQTSTKGGHHWRNAKLTIQLCHLPLLRRLCKRDKMIRALDGTHWAKCMPYVLISVVGLHLFTSFFFAKGIRSTIFCTKKNKKTKPSAVWIRNHWASYNHINLCVYVAVMPATVLVYGHLDTLAISTTYISPTKLLMHAIMYSTFPYVFPCRIK